MEEENGRRGKEKNKNPNLIEFHRRMNSDLGRWVYEFLSRVQKSTNIRITDTLIKKISHPDFHYKKDTLIGFLHRQLSAISITEDMLQKLEVFEEIHCRSGYPVSAALPAAYCAVAVECTLKYLELEPSPSDNPAYISAVDRIWRRRVRSVMETSCVLVSEELKRWNSDIEASFHDPEVIVRFGTLNSRRYAVQKLRVLLDEARKDLDSFLEIAASITDASTSHLKTVKVEDMCDESPIENKIIDAIIDEPVEYHCADTPVQNRSKDAPAANDQSSFDPIEDVGTNAGHAKTTTTAAEDQNLCDPVENMSADADHAMTKTTGAEDKSHDLSENVGADVDHGKSHKTKTTNAEGQSPYDPVENVVANAYHGKTKATADENQSPYDPVENVVANAYHGKTKAIADENQSPYDPIENADANVDQAKTNITAAEGLSPCDSIENVGANADLAKTKRRRVQRTRLMERNNTARTDEWEKSTDDLEEEISNNASRFQLPTPKSRKRSPLKTYDPPKIVRRRKAKKWSTEEEEALRAAVKKIGEGNWKLILDSHKNVFDERTQVDLKDKWRNLKRYGVN